MVSINKQKHNLYNYSNVRGGGKLRSGSEFIILRIPMPENLPFSTRKSAVLVLDVPWRQHFFFSKKPIFFVLQL
jgi:hypothetical protein